MLLYRYLAQGVYAAAQHALSAYEALDADDKIELIVEENTAHECTPTMWKAVLDWLDMHLKA